jgi:hypothetical protein
MRRAWLQMRLLHSAEIGVLGGGCALFFGRGGRRRSGSATVIAGAHVTGWFGDAVVAPARQAENEQRDRVRGDVAANGG